MSTIVTGGQVRAMMMGVRVERAAANLPQTAQAALFTVSGGAILVTGLLGRVTTIIQAQATTLQFISTPTVGSGGNLSIAGADMTGQDVGAMITLPTSAASAPTLSVQAVAISTTFRSVGWIIPAGTIDLKTVASSTGQMKWTLTYIPIDDNALVAAA